MVFSSIFFLFCFLPLVLIIYFICPRRLKNLVLFIFSLIFYAWGEPIYVSLMLFSTIVDYFHGRLVEKYLISDNKKTAKMVVVSSVIINLSLLAFFKYSDFIISLLNSAFRTNIPSLNLPLPIGISFYTFQTMSYTIDIYRNDARAQKNIIAFGTYVALFPQLIAGPIVRYKTIDEQLRSRKTDLSDFGEGVKRFCIGLGKKVLIANSAGEIFNEISKNQSINIPVIMAWTGIIAFAFQIYFDFSGYSDMAIGLGRIFGFKFLENFNYPYISKSITEFWRRWHISLGTWFREYVYIPLGGNRCKPWRRYFNITIVWLLTGVWHGAGWNFILWGVYFGIFLIIEKAFLLKFLENIPAFFSHLYTIFLILISWVIFAFDSVSYGFDYIKSMFGINGNAFYSYDSLYILLEASVIFIIAVIASTGYPAKVFNKCKESFTLELCKGIYLIFILFISTAYLVNSSYNPFLYFRF